MDFPPNRDFPGVFSFRTSISIKIREMVHVPVSRASWVRFLGATYFFPGAFTEDRGSHSYPRSPEFESRTYNNLNFWGMTKLTSVVLIIFWQHTDSNLLLKQEEVWYLVGTIWREPRIESVFNVPVYFFTFWSSEESWLGQGCESESGARSVTGSVTFGCSWISQLRNRNRNRRNLNFCGSGTGTFFNYGPWWNRNRRKMESQIFSQTHYKIVYLISFIYQFFIYILH